MISFYVDLQVFMHLNYKKKELTRQVVHRFFVQKMGIKEYS